jgi:hypothetical protein
MIAMNKQPKIINIINETIDNFLLALYVKKMRRCRNILSNKKRHYKNELIKKLTPSIFWDTNIDILNYKYHDDLIIERIVTFGNKNDEEILFQLYNLYKIRNCIKKLYIYNDSKIEYFSNILNIKKENFKCYGKTPFHVNL